jgi:hypothetical protein
MTEMIDAAKVGDRVRFYEERQAYTVQACGERYVVCTKPFNARKTVLYTVVDKFKQIRGPENLIFGFGAETREQCEEMLARLEGRGDRPRTEVSYRNNIPLVVTAVMKPSNPAPASNR